MLEKLYSLMIEGQEIETLMEGNMIYNPEYDEDMPIADILKDGIQTDPAQYDDRMGLAAGRLDRYIENAVTDKRCSIATELSADHEYEARLNGFILGFKAALQLVNKLDPEAGV